MSKLSCEDGSNCSLAIGVIREVHEDGVGDDIGFICRVDPCKVLVLDEDLVLR